MVLYPRGTRYFRKRRTYMPGPVAGDFESGTENTTMTRQQMLLRGRQVSLASRCSRTDPNSGAAFSSAMNDAPYSESLRGGGASAYSRPRDTSRLHSLSDPLRSSFAPISLLLDCSPSGDHVRARLHVLRTLILLSLSLISAVYSIISLPHLYTRLSEYPLYWYYKDVHL